MSEYDRAPREYRSPPLSDIQNSLPERKVWTRDTPVVPNEKAEFWRGYGIGATTGTLLTGFFALLFSVLSNLLNTPGAY